MYEYVPVVDKKSRLPMRAEQYDLKKNKHEAQFNWAASSLIKQIPHTPPLTHYEPHLPPLNLSRLTVSQPPETSDPAGQLDYCYFKPEFMQVLLEKLQFEISWSEKSRTSRLD